MVIRIPKKLNPTAFLISTVAIVLILQGCVTIDQSEQLDSRRELNALNAMYKGVMKKVDRLDKNTESILRDVEETTTGFASLEVETRSALAESNAELERFREEFGFVRGGIEESAHANNEIRDDIADIKSSLDTITLRLARLENASKLTSEEGTATSRETSTLVTSLETKVTDLSKLNTSLEKRIAKLEGKSTIKTASVKKTDKDPAKLYALGHQNALKKNYSKALKQLKEFLGAFPKHKLADKAQYWLARSYYGNDDWERAVLEFNKVIKNYPKSDRLGPATFMQGLSFLRLDSKKEARVLFNRVLKKFPDTKEAEEAGKRLRKMDLQKQ